MLDTYFVEGGIGKCTAFSALVPKLAEKAGEPIQIYTPYIHAFANNPQVKMVFEQQSIPQSDPRLMASDNFHYSEPYKSNFIFGKQHLIEAYCNLHGVEFEDTMVPKMYTDHLKEAATAWLVNKQITGKYMMIQLSGGQTPVGFKPDQQYISSNPTRNYPPFLANQIINRLRQEFPDVTIIDCTLPNEPTYEGTIKCDEHWSVVHELMKGAEGFISIDSCMNHFSASTGVAGVVIWGSTRWVQFGYDHNSNLHYHMKNKWNESKFDPDDPRNIMVDPEIVVNNYIRRIKNVGRTRTDDGRGNHTSIRCLRS